MERADRFGEKLSGRSRKAKADLHQLEAECRELEASRDSLTTEYPANGSFFRPQTLVTPTLTSGGGHAVCKELSEGASSFQFPASSKSVELLLGAGSWELVAVTVSFEFLMVKLLRAYGECLGARSL